MNEESKIFTVNFGHHQSCLRYKILSVVKTEINGIFYLDITGTTPINNKELGGSKGYRTCSTH